MTDLIYDYITMGVDMLISAVILSSVVSLLYGTTILNSYSAQQQATAARVDYYKEYSIYDCKEGLSSADVISALSYYNKSIVIQVEYTDASGNYIITNDNPSTEEIDPGGYYKKKGTNAATVINYDTARNDIKSNWKFKAVIYEDGKQSASENGYTGGVITAIKFTKQP